jgi:two-component system, OmpR family, alkaline phosphatase synthesis response regulator PhoP
MIKIFVVEDEIPISNLIKLNHNISNYECIQCYDGQEALTVTENEKFDLVLLDIMLPRHALEYDLN